MEIKYKKLGVFLRNDNRASEITEDGLYEIEYSIFDMQRKDCRLISLTENYKTLAEGTFSELEDILKNYYNSPLCKERDLFILEKKMGKISFIYDVTGNTLNFLKHFETENKGTYNINGEIYKIRKKE